MKKLSIVIPAYNEEERIGGTLEEYGKFFNDLKKKKKIDFEINVVINNTTDDTLGVVKKWKKKFKEIRILNFKKGGKGFAIIQGFKDALKRRNDLIGFIDADMATPPEAFYDLVEKINDYEGVIASRWMKDSNVKRSILKKIQSTGFNFLVRSILFLNFKDTQCGAKLFTRQAIKIVVDYLEITRWAFDIDLLFTLKKKGFRVIEIPTVWEDKSGSKISLFVPIKMFSGIIRLRLNNSPFKFIVRAYDILPEKFKIHSL